MLSFVTGHLTTVLNDAGSQLTCSDVVHIFGQACLAIQHMHRQNPPIIHRDLKVCMKAKRYKAELNEREFLVVM